MAMDSSNPTYKSVYVDDSVIFQAENDIDALSLVNGMEDEYGLMKHLIEIDNNNKHKRTVL